MAKKTRRKNLPRDGFAVGEQATPERLMELSFAYAPPVMIGAGVTNQVFRFFGRWRENIALRARCNCAARLARARCLTVKRRWRQDLSSAKNAVCQLSCHRRHRATSGA